MRTARSARDFCRQLASHLGADWRTCLTGHSDRAVLEGPKGIELNVEVDVTARTARVEACADSSLVWPEPGDQRIAAHGPLKEPAAMAERIATEIAPAYERRTRELTARTQAAEAALSAFLDQAVVGLGEGVQVQRGSRPAVATVRWPGGVVHVYTDGRSRVLANAVELRYLDAATTLGVLSAARA